MQRLAVLMICLGLFLPGSLAAQDNLMKDVFVLDSLVVTGEADEKIEGLDRSSAVVVERNRSNNISDFLVKDTEISINRRANFGDSSDIVSIRGFGSDRIKLNMDGRDISSTGVVGGNYLDFGTIPLDNIERIEVIKGGSAIEYGNTALGGVINAYSRKPKPTPYLSLYATMGGWSDAYDFHNVRGNYAQKFGPLGAALGISHQKNEAFLWNNDFELLHFNPKLYLDLPWRGELSFSYNYSRANRGLIRSNRADGNPGSDGNPYRAGWNTPINPGYPTASGESFAGANPSPAMYIIGDGGHWVKQRHLLDLGYRQEVGQSGFYELTAFSSYETRRERNYADNTARLVLKDITDGDLFDPARTEDGALVMDKKLNVDRSYGYTFKAGLEHNDHKIKFGADYMIRRSGGQHVNFVDENYNLRRQAGAFTGAMDNSRDGLPNYILGVYAGDQYRINQHFTLDYGLRYDGYDARNRQVGGGERSFKDSAFSPKTMLTWSIDDYQAASLALYRNKRVPSGPEYSWFTMAADPMAGGTLLKSVAYTDLAMEDARGVDLAYKFTFDNNGFAKISTWYYDIKDYINMRSGLPGSEKLEQPYTGGNLRTAYNMDARMYGVTLSAMYPFTPDFSLHGGVTWQDNKKRNDMFDPDRISNSLEYVPEWKGNLGFGWQIIEGLNLDADLLYVSKRHYFFSANNRYEIGRLGSYVTLGASLSYKLNKNTTLEIYADNITDVDYEERWGYPSMGFNAGVSLKLQL